MAGCYDVPYDVMMRIPECAAMYQDGPVRRQVRQGYFTAGCGNDVNVRCTISAWVLTCPPRLQATDPSASADQPATGRMKQWVKGKQISFPFLKKPSSLINILLGSGVCAQARLAVDCRTTKPLWHTMRCRCPRLCLKSNSRP
jgi:hypothetical protein